MSRPVPSRPPVRRCGVILPPKGLDERHRFGLASMAPTPALAAEIDAALLSWPEPLRASLRALAARYGVRVLNDVRGLVAVAQSLPNRA